MAGTFIEEYEKAGKSDFTGDAETRSLGFSHLAGLEGAVGLFAVVVHGHRSDGLVNRRRIVWALPHQVHTAALGREPGQVRGRAALLVISGGVDANLARAVQDLADAFRLYQSRITEPSVALKWP